MSRGPDSTVIEKKGGKYVTCPIVFFSTTVSKRLSKKQTFSCKSSYVRCAALYTIASADVYEIHPKNDFNKT